MAASINSHIPGKPHLERIRNNKNGTSSGLKAVASSSCFALYLLSQIYGLSSSASALLRPEPRPWGKTPTRCDYLQKHAANTYPWPPARPLNSCPYVPTSDIIPTHSSFASMPPLWSVHLVVVVVEGVFGCVCLQNSLQQKSLGSLIKNTNGPVHDSV